MQPECRRSRTLHQRRLTQGMFLGNVEPLGNQPLQLSSYEDVSKEQVFFPSPFSYIPSNAPLIVPSISPCVSVLWEEGGCYFEQRGREGGNEKERFFNFRCTRRTSGEPLHMGFSQLSLPLLWISARTAADGVVILLACGSNFRKKGNESK